jgi:hypothetical protein
MGNNPQFEVRRKPDERAWEILVTWGHSLRHEIAGVIFNSEKEALHWIEWQSSIWMAGQNCLPATRASRRPSKKAGKRIIQTIRGLHHEHSVELARS